MTLTTTSNLAGAIGTEILGVMAKAHKPNTFMRSLVNTYNIEGKGSLVKSINKRVKLTKAAAGTEGTAVSGQAWTLETRVDITAGELVSALQPTNKALMVAEGVTDLASLTGNDRLAALAALEGPVAELAGTYEDAVEAAILAKLSSLTDTTGLVTTQLSFLDMLDALYAYKIKNQANAPFAYLLPMLGTKMLQRAQIGTSGGLSGSWWVGKEALGEANVQAGQAGTFLGRPVFEHAPDYNQAVTVVSDTGLIGCIFALGSPNAGDMGASPDAPFGAFSLVEAGDPIVTCTYNGLGRWFDLVVSGYAAAGLNSQKYAAAIYMNDVIA